MAWAAATPTTLESLLAERGLKAFQGKINPWDMPMWKPTIEGIRTQGQRRLEDLYGGFRKAGVTGPAAGTLLERSEEATGGNTLDLANRLLQVPETYIGQGVQAEEAAIGRGEAAQKWLDEKIIMRKRAKEAEAAAKQSSQQGMGMKMMSPYGQGGGGGGGGGCCFIFIEGQRLTDNVRNLRDFMFPKGGTVEIGYRRISRWLTPRMARNWFVKKVVQIIMLDPICSIADHFYGYNHYGWILRPVGYFWKGVFEKYGKAKGLY
jgi:hypothetical protein